MDTHPAETLDAPSSDGPIPGHEANAGIGPGTVVGRFGVLELLGEGAQGRVFRGEHLMLGYPVAIKVPDGAGPGGEVNRERHRREARLGAAVRHRNVATVLEAGRTVNDEHYVVMEYVDGHSLEQAIGDGLPPRAVAEVGLQLCAALCAFESQAVVHRDVKPGNILIERTIDGSPQLRLLDFGLAKSSTNEAMRSVTRDGSVLGTPYYMAPEQLCSGDLDGRTDVYALGATLFECLTGRPTHDGATVHAVLASLATRRAPFVHDVQPECPGALADAIDRALERDPDDRWSGAAEMACALRAAADVMDADPAQAGWRARLGETSAEPRATPGSQASASALRTARRLLRSPGGRFSVGLAAASILAIAVASATVLSGAAAAGPAEPAESGLERGAPAPERALTEAELIALEGSARGLFVRGESHAALNLYGQVTRQDPQRASGWRGLGLVASSLGDEATAERALRRYLSLDPGAPDREEIRARLPELDGRHE